MDPYNLPCQKRTFTSRVRSLEGLFDLVFIHG
jgi:hypothetical protein